MVDRGRCWCTTTVRTTPPRVIRDLEERYPFARGIWLSRNFGQHPATLAGMASSGGDWIVTLDEDGQHDPAYIGRLLDTALARARPGGLRQTDQRRPARLRCAMSRRRTAKRLISGSGGVDASRLPELPPRPRRDRPLASRRTRGPASTSTSPSAGWRTGSPTCPVELRDEGRTAASGYSYRRLLSHFWRMVLSSGTKGLRMVSVFGVVAAVLGRRPRAVPADRGAVRRPGHPGRLAVADGGAAGGHRRDPVLARHRRRVHRRRGQPWRWAGRCTSSSATRRDGPLGAVRPAPQPSLPPPPPPPPPLRDDGISTPGAGPAPPAATR